MEEGSRASRNEDRGYAAVPVQLLHPAKEGYDGFLLGMDHGLHECIPYHKIRGTGILIDQKCTTPGEDRFYGVGSLRRTSAGILRGEGYRILPVWKVPYKCADIQLLYASPVFRTDLHGAVFRQHILPSVSRYMVIDASLQGLQQSGFPMISSTDDQGDPFFDPQSGDAASLGEFQGDPVLCRTFKGNRRSHGGVIHAAFPGKDRPVCDKCHKPGLRQLIPDRTLIVRQSDPFFCFSFRQSTGEQTVFHSSRDIVEEHFL